MADSQFLTVKDFEAKAATALPTSAWGYFSSGVADEITLRRNETTFDNVELLPRVLVDVGPGRIDPSATLLGRPVALPFSIAPTAYHRLAHEHGEIGTARAAAAAGVCFCVSSSATTSFEEVAAAQDQAAAAAAAAASDASVPPAMRWMQLYMLSDRRVTVSMLQRAEAAGYSAVVWTVDRPVLGLRHTDTRNGFDLPPHLGAPNFEISMAQVAESPPEEQGAAATGGGGKLGSAYRVCGMAADMTLHDLAILRSATRLPIVVKGVLSPEDAAMLVKEGVAAIWVSNHGGRQLDSVPPALEVLPSILASVRAAEAECGRNTPGKSVEVYVDGGVRRGSDILKALALGADHVFIGRPVIYGLTVAGERGVSRVLSILRDEVRNGMALLGVTRVAQLGLQHVRWRYGSPQYLQMLHAGATGSAQQQQQEHKNDSAAAVLTTMLAAVVILRLIGGK